ncbi:MAG: hypothetical protein ABW170_15190 [Candidatus Thiodiazotropha sp. L084R]
MSVATTSLNTQSRQAAASHSQAGNAAAQTPGMQLYVRALNGSQKETVVKRQFEQTSPDKQTDLADEFVSAAGEEGVNQFAETTDGQYALKAVYGHAGNESRSVMESVHEQQGNTAVDYTQNESKTDSQIDLLLSIAGDVITSSSGGGAAFFKSSERVLNRVEQYDKHLKEYDDLKNHKAAPSTVTRKEQELVRAFDELSGELRRNKLPIFERYTFGTKEGINQNGRVVRESVPVSSCDDAQKMMKYAKIGRIAGPALIALDGVLRTKSVIDKYNANDPSWKREAVVQSAGFVGGIGVGVLIGGAIALTPVGLVTGLVIGGFVAFGADLAIKSTVETVYSFFE